MSEETRRLEQAQARRFRESLTPEDFSREDETDDAVFYARERFVSHLDSLALSTVERIVGELLAETDPAVLDLMAGWDSHIPSQVKPSRVVGLGLNENELRANERLGDFVMHDLNKNPRLPFAGQTFDVVINTVSVDYMTRPMEVFQDVARILKPGGLFLVLSGQRGMTFRLAFDPTARRCVPLPVSSLRTLKSKIADRGDQDPRTDT